MQERLGWFPVPLLAVVVFIIDKAEDFIVLVFFGHIGIAVAEDPYGRILSEECKDSLCAIKIGAIYLTGGDFSYKVTSIRSEISVTALFA